MVSQADNGRTYHPEQGWRLPNGDLLIPYSDESGNGVLEVPHRDQRFPRWSQIVRENRKRLKPLYDLHAAAENGDLVHLEALLDRGLDPGTVLPTDRSRDFPLRLAANYPAAVRLLLQRGADPDQQTAGGRFALLEAAALGPDESLAVLLRYGADPCLQTENGWTALMLAAGSAAAVERVRLLLEQGADPLQQNAGGETALTISLDCQPSDTSRGDTEEARTRHRERRRLTIGLLAGAQPGGAKVVARWQEER